jgi:hypothetical protein
MNPDGFPGRSMRSRCEWRREIISYGATLRDLRNDPIYALFTNVPDPRPRIMTSEEASRVI